MWLKNTHCGWFLFSDPPQLLMIYNNHSLFGNVDNWGKALEQMNIGEPHQNVMMGSGISQSIHSIQYVFTYIYYKDGFGAHSPTSLLTHNACGGAWRLHNNE